MEDRNRNNRWMGATELGEKEMGLMYVISSGAERVKMKTSPGTTWVLMRRSLGCSVVC